MNRFRGGRRPAERQHKSPLNLASQVMAGVTLEPPGEQGRLIFDEGAVQQIERLQGRRGSGPARFGKRPVRAIEQPKNGIPLRTRLKLIDHPAILFRAQMVARLEHHHVVRVFLPKKIARTTHFFVELPIDRENRITDRFRFESSRSLAAQQAILPVDSLRHWVDLT